MKLSALAVLAFTFFFLFTGCEHEDTDPKPFTLPEEYNTGGTYVLEIRFDGPQGIGILNPKFSISLYGYDVFIADAAATLITRQHFICNSLPFTFKLKVPDDASDLIEPVSGENRFEYYYHLDWDSDNNGQLCEGDLQVDYLESWPNILMDSTLQQVYTLVTLPSVYACK